MIPIHALREEGDCRFRWLTTGGCKISIHALREEGDQKRSRQTWWRRHFYPRPPRGGRPTILSIQIWDCPFLSTPSARRATCNNWCKSTIREISIHALREEGDDAVQVFLHSVFNFYPRPPRGGRQAGCHNQVGHNAISIHALREEGDTGFFTRFIMPCISIHALREEGDCTQGAVSGFGKYFYPRPPRGGRHADALELAYRRIISIHALREEGDSFRGDPPPLSDHFYPRPPRGGRQMERARANTGYLFLSTPSARRATPRKCPKLPEFVFLSTPSARRATYHLSYDGIG